MENVVDVNLPSVIQTRVHLPPFYVSVRSGQQIKQQQTPKC